MRTLVVMTFAIIFNLVLAVSAANADSNYEKTLPVGEYRGTTESGGHCYVKIDKPRISHNDDLPGQLQFTQIEFKSSSSGKIESCGYYPKKVKISREGFLTVLGSGDVSTCKAVIALDENGDIKMADLTIRLVNIGGPDETCTMQAQ